MREYSDQVMAYREGAEPRIFYGWWVAAAFSLIIFLSTGARFAVGPFLKPVVSDLGLGFSMSLLSAHGVPMLTDHGFHEMTASSAIGVLGMTSIGGGMLLGILSDRWGTSLCSPPSISFAWSPSASSSLRAIRRRSQW